MLLDCEEALATQRIGAALQHLAEDLCRGTDARARIRRNPFLATGLGAGLGFLGGPALLRALQRLLGATAEFHVPGAHPPYTLSGAVLASLRLLRAGH